MIASKKALRVIVTAIVIVDQMNAMTKRAVVHAQDHVAIAMDVVMPN